MRELVENRALRQLLTHPLIKHLSQISGNTACRRLSSTVRNLLHCSVANTHSRLQRELASTQIPPVQTSRITQHSSTHILSVQIQFAVAQINTLRLTIMRELVENRALRQLLTHPLIKHLSQISGNTACRRLSSTVRNLLHCSVADAHRRLQTKLASIKIPKILTNRITQHASINTISINTRTISKILPIPITIRLQRISHTPKTAANLNSLSRVLIFRLIINHNPIIRSKIRVPTASIKNLIHTPYKITNVNALTISHRVPLARLSDNSIKLLLLSKPFLRIRLMNIAKRNTGCINRVK